MEKDYKNKRGLVLTREEKNQFDELVKACNAKRAKELRKLKKIDLKEYALITNGLEGLNGRENISTYFVPFLSFRNCCETSLIDSKEELNKEIDRMNNFLNSNNYLEEYISECKNNFIKVNEITEVYFKNKNDFNEFIKLLKKLTLVEFHILLQHHKKSTVLYDIREDSWMERSHLMFTESIDEVEEKLKYETKYFIKRRL